MSACECGKPKNHCDPCSTELRSSKEWIDPRPLTERLRSGFGGLVPPVCDEAANHIDFLEREVATLRVQIDVMSASSHEPPLDPLPDETRAATSRRAHGTDDAGSPGPTPPPSPARKPDKFDLAFEIMRQLEAEDMDTMQSCQFGYVMRVTKEGTGCGQVEFRPIATAPKDGSTILLRCPKGIVEGCWEQVDGGGHPENGPPVYWWTSPFTEFIDGPYDAPTHWALIPRDALTKGGE
jgi:hypothetical protein